MHLKPVQTLRGHRDSIIKVLASQNQIITIDEMGHCRWWNMSGELEGELFFYQLS